MDEINAKLGAVLYTNNEPNELFIEYVAALVGREHNGSPERCLLHGNNKPLKGLLNNTDIATAIITIQDNAAIEKWRSNPPSGSEFPLASTFFSPAPQTIKKTPLSLPSLAL